MHDPDCNQHGCLVVQGKKQETNTGGTAKMPNHYRCNITCAKRVASASTTRMSPTTSSAWQPR